MNENGKALIAAAIIMASFVTVAFFMPDLMLAIGGVSPVAAGALAVLFVAAFFAVFWLRGRRRNKERWRCGCSSRARPA